MEYDAAAGTAPSGPAGGLNTQNFAEMEAKLEEMFERADHLMISQKNYKEAVSYL